MGRSHNRVLSHPKSLCFIQCLEIKFSYQTVEHIAYVVIPTFHEMRKRDVLESDSFYSASNYPSDVYSIIVICFILLHIVPKWSMCWASSSKCSHHIIFAESLVHGVNWAFALDWMHDYAQSIVGTGFRSPIRDNPEFRFGLFKSNLLYCELL